MKWKLKQETCIEAGKNDYYMIYNNIT